MPLPKLETPTYKITIPSTGASTVFRPFLVKEHKILLTLAEADELEISRVITDLIDACTFNKLRMDELSNFDIEYLFLMLRAKSIGETMDLVLTCENCKEKNDVTVNLLNAKIDKQENHSNKIKIGDDITIILNYPRFEDVLKLFQNGSEVDTFDLVVKSIKSIYTSDESYDAKDQSYEELSDFVNSMSKDQFDKLENFFLTMPKLVQSIEKDCEKCGHHNKVVLEGLQNFFV